MFAFSIIYYQGGRGREREEERNKTGERNIFHVKGKKKIEKDAIRRAPYGRLFYPSDQYRTRSTDARI